MGGMTPQTPRDFKDAAFGHTARIGAALGNATRVEIMDVLLQGERSVESLAQQVAASVANTSRHLQILAAAGMVTRRAEGTTRYYRVADDEVAVVGSINLDYRSLYLHYECAAWMFKSNAVLQVRDDYDELLCVSKQVSLVDCQNVSAFKSLLNAVLRLFAPLM